MSRTLTLAALRDLHTDHAVTAPAWESCLEGARAGFLWRIWSETGQSFLERAPTLDEDSHERTVRLTFAVQRSMGLPSEWRAERITLAESALRPFCAALRGDWRERAPTAAEARAHLGLWWRARAAPSPSRVTSSGRFVTVDGGDRLITHIAREWDTTGGEAWRDGAPVCPCDLDGVPVAWPEVTP